MSVERSFEEFYEDPSLAAADRILDLVERREAAESQRLDAEDALDRAAQERVDADNAALVSDAEEQLLLDAFAAADLAQCGFDPGWDWRAVLNEHGFDERGNPTKRGQCAPGNLAVSA